MRELEVHNVTKWEPEAIRDLLVSRGFKEEKITPEHPGFKETEEYFQKMKAAMPKEEYERLLKEMEDLMGDNKTEEPQEEEKKDPSDK